jgi:hypothetical protein
MSDHIAHIGICDDTFRLAKLHPEIDPRLAELMDEQRDIAHLGSITRFADKWSVDLLAWAGQEYDKPEAPRDPNLGAKIAFELGALTHRAADRLTKPITRCWKGDDTGGDANTSKIMQDLLVLREVFGHGEGPHAGPFAKPILTAFNDEQGQPLEAAFRALLTRALIGMHTIKPDPAHIHEWLDALLDAVQTYPKSLAYYAELDAAWDPATVKQYLTNKHFYDRDDELIRLARAIQHGQTVTAQQVTEAKAATPYDVPGPSRYARALSRALDYLAAAGRIVRGELSRDEANAALDIGVPELSLDK